MILLGFFLQLEGDKSKKDNRDAYSSPRPAWILQVAFQFRQVVCCRSVAGWSAAWIIHNANGAFSGAACISNALGSASFGLISQIHSARPRISLREPPLRNPPKLIIAVSVLF